MPFSTNQIVWARTRTDDWQPAFVIDVANDIWSLWSGPIEQLKTGHRHVFIISSKSIELVKEEDNIRDFCLGYAESYESVPVGSDAMKALPLLVQMAAILSGEEIYPGQDWDWQSWAINSIHNCEPIRVSKKFYEKFTKKDMRPDSPPMRHSSSPSPENTAGASVFDDAVATDEVAPLPKRRLRARKTVKNVVKSSPKSVETDESTTIFLPESSGSEMKNSLRTAQLVWAFRSGALKERWWPAVVIEMPDSGASSAVIAALNKTNDLFCTKLTLIEDFCRNFNRRVDRVALDDPEERGNYKFAVRKAVEYAQDAIGGVNCEQDQWLNWALKNVACHGKGEIGLSGTQWIDIVARTQNQLIQLKRREIYGAVQRATSTEPLSSEKSATKSNRPTSTPPESSKKAEPEASVSKREDDHAVSDMDQMADGLKSDETSTNLSTNLNLSKKRQHDSDLNTTKSSPPAKAKKSMQSRPTEDEVKHRAKKSLRTPEKETRVFTEEKKKDKKEKVHLPQPSPSPVKSSPTKRGPRRSSSGVDVSLLALPLDAGWLREITVRKTGEKRACDVYYFYPKGISFKGNKVRSGKEIDVLLADNPSHPACTPFESRVHFSFNGTLMTGHSREVLHAAGEKISADLKATVHS